MQIDDSDAIHLPFRGKPDVWSEPVRLQSAHALSSLNRPLTIVRAGFDDDGISIRFDVNDQFVLAQRIEHQSDVYADSCVEFFFSPSGFDGYFNFEFNCIGTTLARFNATATGVCTTLDVTQINTVTSQREPIPVEIPSLDWMLETSIPWSLLLPFGRFVPPDLGTVWRGNFYKCADATSHPHWLSWRPIGDRLSFHKPHRFGKIKFGKGRSIGGGESVKSLWRKQNSGQHS